MSCITLLRHGLHLELLLPRPIVIVLRVLLRHLLLKLPSLSRATKLTRRHVHLLLLKQLLLLLGIHFGLMIQYILSLLAAHIILAACALAVGLLARDAHLEALTVLLEALTPFAAAALGVPQLVIGSAIVHFTIEVTCSHA